METEGVSMANFPRWVAEMSFLDGANRPSTVTYYVPEATAKLYMAAANKAARDLTAIGLLFEGTKLVVSGAETSRKVWVEDQSSPITLPADSVLRGNKIVVGFLAAARNYTLTLPMRNASSYTQKEASIEIDITASGDFADWITLFDATCLSVNGGSAEITKAYLND